MFSRSITRLRYILLISLFAYGCNTNELPPELDSQKLSQQYFKEDYNWFLENIPFFECSDKEIESVYYYRWQMYKAHLRNVAANKYVITEFINHVPWDREPWCTINAASMHHIYEGRWLKDPRYIDSYVNYLLREGGNNRRYSESISDAAYAHFMVTGDKEFILSQLDSMKAKFEGWYDHWDSAKNMYYIPAMPDATEYTIASIDATGGKDGFDDGEAFRPTINSYMYGNAIAISKLASLNGDTSASETYRRRATDLKENVIQHLWNDSLKHFLDRFKVDNQFVHYWDFIRGRELAGMAPWYFNLPPDQMPYPYSWKHVLDTTQLLGPFGFRTNEPSYQYYFKQFVWFEGKRGSQWNGPNWPFQSSIVLTGMANLLHNYNQEIVSTSDYLKLLRLYTRQHYLPDGKINLVENYDPNAGGPIVHFTWSNHYNHSSFNNLIINGLCGIIPTDKDSVGIHPLIDSSVSYFFLDDIRYHGHSLTVIYDRDGTKYKAGKGISVYVDGKKAAHGESGKKLQVYTGVPVLPVRKNEPENYALNIAKKEFPKPSASVNSVPDSLFPAIDGRIWYYPEIHNRWTSLGSSATLDWYEIDFGENKEISELAIDPVVDNILFQAPDSLYIAGFKNEQWEPIHFEKSPSDKIPGNSQSVFPFQKTKTSKVRIYFRHLSRQIALTEIELN